MRKYYSIESAILEKRLICDYSKLIYIEIVHNLTDIKAWYDHQLENLGSIIEELVSIEHEPIRLFIKVLPRFKYFIYTRYRISKTYYDGLNNLASRTG